VPTNFALQGEKVIVEQDGPNGHRVVLWIELSINSDIRRGLLAQAHLEGSADGDQVRENMCVKNNVAEGHTRLVQVG
jgi:hypothetical protein